MNTTNPVARRARWKRKLRGDGITSEYCRLRGCGFPPRPPFDVRLRRTSNGAQRPPPRVRASSAMASFSARETPGENWYSLCYCTLPISSMQHRPSTTSERAWVGLPNSYSKSDRPLGRNCRTLGPFPLLLLMAPSEDERPVFLFQRARRGTGLVLFKIEYGYFGPF